MSLPTALAYTGVSEKQMRQWQRDGAVLFVAKGPNGSLIALRGSLNEALRQLVMACDASWDLDFGD